jgi:hypothetical protein
LVIIPKPKGYDKTFYVGGMSLFKLILNNANQIIKPGEIKVEGVSDEVKIDGVTTTTYKFFPAKYVETVNSSSNDIVSNKDEIKYETYNKQDVDYSVYKPFYNIDGQKVRSVSAKESNYFNILQSIAETFEIWVELEVKRDNYGGITEKWVKFKNYAGEENNAFFQYGVNLKDIQRTFASKNITTKLIVKQNSN